MEVREWLSYAESRLKSLEVESAGLEAQLLAAHVLRVDRVWLYAHPEAEFPELAGENLLERRGTGEPLAYILGWREFYGRPFGVDRSVLIPRQDTETLVETALRYSPSVPNPVDPSNISVLDVGTGSGILAITLKLERPLWHVTAVDISPEALSTASANAKFHGAGIDFRLSDGFEALLGESFDLIVSNPPYIGRNESLSREVAQFEPGLALFAENEGLAFFEMLSAKAPSYLRDDGILVVEIGYEQSKSVAALFEDDGWKVMETVSDLSGTERVLVLQYAYRAKGKNDEPNTLEG